MCTNWLKKQKVYGTNKKYVELVSDHFFKGKVVVSNTVDKYFLLCTQSKRGEANFLI